MNLKQIQLTICLFIAFSTTNFAQDSKFESFSNYDFIAGDKVLFYEDFSQDNIGDFPDLWASNGSGEIKTVSIDKGKWFHLNGEDATYCFTKTIIFPSNFIMEFDIIPDNEYTEGIMLTFYQEEEKRELNDELYPGERGLHITIRPNAWETKGYSIDNEEWLEGQGKKAPVIKEKVNHVIIWVQNRRVRIYSQGEKVVDAATNIYSDTKFNKFRFSGWDRASFPFIGNLKITTAAPDTRNKLLKEGKLISYGIYFDSGKDVVKQESYGAIKEIATVMQENPTLKINIVGHTDSDGDDAANLALSKKRAESVKNFLVKEFKIDAGRMQTDGKGETEPVTDNIRYKTKPKTEE